jgi:hypothetical protein
LDPAKAVLDDLARRAKLDRVTLVDASKAMDSSDVAVLELARGEKIEVARLSYHCQNTVNRRRTPPTIGLVGFFQKGRG